MNPSVSVAIATFNGERFLREQLESIYAQTFSDFEVVVSDDGSTDGTLPILREFSHARGLRVSIAPQRLGLVGNFERAISQCRGQIIALSDQDDLWKPQKIERLRSALESCSLTYCSTEDQIDETGASVVEPDAVQTSRFARAHGSGKPTRYLLAENWVVSHGVCFRATLRDQALPIPRDQHFHDAWLALVASCSEGLRFVDEPLQTYRKHAASLTYISPNARAARQRSGQRLADGKMAWAQRCEKETSRLRSALVLPSLSAGDRAFVAKLLTYYRAGLEPGYRWRAFLAGLEVAPYFSTLFDRPRWRMALRPLLVGR